MSSYENKEKFHVTFMFGKKDKCVKKDKLPDRFRLVLTRLSNLFLGIPGIAPSFTADPFTTGVDKICPLTVIF